MVANAVLKLEAGVRDGEDYGELLVEVMKAERRTGMVTKYGRWVDVNSSSSSSSSSAFAAAGRRG